jgi:hypothetical protein
MTYDPNDPHRPAATHNSPSIRERASNGPLMAVIAVAIVIGLGILFYALNNDGRMASTTPEPATTGQSQPTTSPPQKAPSPAPTPAPTQKNK